MTDQATIALRPAGPADAEAIAALFTDEGYPAGPSDIVARLERFATPEARVVVAEHEGRCSGSSPSARCRGSSTTTGSSGSSPSSSTPGRASAASAGR